MGDPVHFEVEARVLGECKGIEAEEEAQALRETQLLSLRRRSEPGTRVTRRAQGLQRGVEAPARIPPSLPPLPSQWPQQRLSDLNLRLAAAAEMKEEVGPEGAINGGN